MMDQETARELLRRWYAHGLRVTARPISPDAAKDSVVTVAVFELEITSDSEDGRVFARPNPWNASFPLPEALLSVEVAPGEFAVAHDGWRYTVEPHVGPGRRVRVVVHYPLVPHGFGSPDAVFWPSGDGRIESHLLIQPKVGPHWDLLMCRVEGFDWGGFNWEEFAFYLSERTPWSIPTDGDYSGQDCWETYELLDPDPPSFLKELVRFEAMGELFGEGGPLNASVSKRPL